MVNENEKRFHRLPSIYSGDHDILDCLFGYITPQGRKLMLAFDTEENLRLRIASWIDVQRRYLDRIKYLSKLGDDRILKLNKNGFFVVKDFVKIRDFNKLSKKFLLKSWLMSGIRGATFNNCSLDTIVPNNYLNTLSKFVDQFELYPDGCFEKSNFQVSTSPASINGKWEADTFEYHIDVPSPNLKAFILANNHNDDTGYYSVFDLEKLNPNRFFYLTLATGLSAVLQPNLIFNAGVTEKFGSSGCRNIFSNQFCESFLIQDPEPYVENFKLNHGDLIVSNNMVPHARVSGKPGWKNRRSFIHPLPYPRIEL